MSDVYNIQEIIGSGQNLISCSCNRRQYTHSTLTLSLACIHMFLSTRSTKLCCMSSLLSLLILCSCPALPEHQNFLCCLVGMINEMVVTVDGHHLSICSSNCFNVVLIDLLELLERGSQVHQ